MPGHTHLTDAGDGPVCMSSMKATISAAMVRAWCSEPRKSASMLATWVHAQPAVHVGDT